MHGYFTCKILLELIKMSTKRLKYYSYKDFTLNKN